MDSSNKKNLHGSSIEGKNDAHAKQQKSGAQHEAGQKRSTGHVASHNAERVEKKSHANGSADHSKVRKVEDADRDVETSRNNGKY